MLRRPIRSLVLTLGLAGAAVAPCKMLLAVVLTTVSLASQDAKGTDVLVALDRWTRSFTAGSIDITRPTPIDKDAPTRVPRRLLASASQRLTELQALEILLRAGAELGTRSAAERLLRLAAIGFEPRSAKLDGAVIVQGAAEGALDECSAPAVLAYLIDVTQASSKNTEDTALRIAAVRGLGGSAQPVFWPVLTGLLRDPEPLVRSAAARALGDLGRPQSIADVAQSLRVENEPSVIQTIALALRDLLEVAERNESLDPVLHLDAVGAVIGVLQRTDDWRIAADLVRFLERHRVADAVPVLIEVMARAEVPGGNRTLRTEAHRALRAMTGAVMGADQIDLWRDMWASAKDNFKIVSRRQEPLPDKATVAGGFFGIPVLGQRVVFVIDCSGSMVSPAPQADDTVTGLNSAPTRLDIARRECWNAVKEMPPDSYFNLVVFSSNARAWKPELVPATPANKGALRNFLQRLIADGSTNLWEGLSTALEMRTAMTKSRYREPVDEVFILSDGHPSSGEITDAPTIVARVSEQNKHTGIRLNTVFVGSMPSELDAIAQPGGNALMRVLAEQNRGKFVER